MRDGRLARVIWYYTFHSNAAKDDRITKGQQPFQSMERAACSGRQISAVPARQSVRRWLGIALITEVVRFVTSLRRRARLGYPAWSVPSQQEIFILSL